MIIKPGYRTSEFWFTLVSFIFSGAYLTGLISDNNQKEDLIAETSRGVEAVILIIGQLTVLYKYINSRKEIKTASKPRSGVKKNVNSRTNKSRSTKSNRSSKK